MRAARNRPRVVGFSRVQAAELRAERPFPQAQGRPWEPLGGGSATTELDSNVAGTSRALERMACYLRHADRHVCLLEGALWNGPGRDWADLVHKGPNSSSGPFKKTLKAQVFLTTRTQMTIFFFVLLNKGEASVCSILLFFMHTCLSFGGKERHTQPCVLWAARSKTFALIRENPDFKNLTHFNRGE